MLAGALAALLVAGGGLESATATPNAASVPSVAPNAPAIPSPAPNAQRFAAAPTPTVSGTPRAGLTLTATIGTWKPSIEPSSYLTSWSVGGTTLTRSVNSPTLLLTAGDVGKPVTFTVVSQLPGYERLVRTSAPTAAVSAGVSLVRPGTASVTGSGLVGQTLTAVAAGWIPDPIAFTYQWSVGGRAVAGAAAKTYTPTAADAAKRVTVSITGSYPGATPATRIAALTGSVTQLGSIAGTVYASAAPVRIVTNGSVALFTGDAGRYTEPLARTVLVNGTYSFAGLVPGEYTVRFTDESTGQQAFIGGGNTAGGSTAITVTSGRQTTRNYTFSATGSISGVLTLDGPPASPDDAFVVEATSSKGFDYAVAAADGTFTISGLPGGSYTLAVHTSNNRDQVSIYNTGVYTVGPNATPGRVPVAADRTTTGIAIVMKPAPVIAGVATLKDTGSPSPYTLIEVYSVGGASDGFVDSSQTETDGRFRAPLLEPGSYKLVARPPAGEGLAVTFIGGTSFETARVFTVKNGDTVGGVTVAIPTEAVLTGVIIAQDTELPIQSDITLVPEANALDILPTTVKSTDELGRFSADGLPAGRYTIRVHPVTGSYPEAVWGEGAPGGARVITLVAGRTTDIRVVALRLY
ncbi:hypothetical protein B7R25_01440 [Subtercola boreus]|uniref:Alpha-amylase n=2 Tax=Subtercola boreus TaxID=120213 RepID=A0A3E0WGE5_9MICO|nr:hypothetical protein B7R24_01445 [Subtercola boreus]RFA23965.1 hypothetical protein B7R23_01445 [Subtercola boreus]RFA29663.1 hypothetical protein B7R25_01440 [Subtercola boreus]